MQNYANSPLNLIRSICYITLVALNINSVQFYKETKNIQLFIEVALFCNLQVLVIAAEGSLLNF